MRPQEIIGTKRDGGALSAEAIHSFVRGVTDGSWADYQASALLMAIFQRGMNADEQSALTQAMWHSGETLDWSALPAPKVDKHSTGGVGDKTSLILAPIVAACGGCVPMISGRGLGHTGGTLDKLESIAGYRVRLEKDEFGAILEKIGFAMMGQTATIAPADRKLYALRDATATVEAIPLIVASIMSKKLAAGLDALVLDVKSGSGAFMRDTQKARELATELVKTGKACGVKTLALLTDMSEPLGAVGNALEVRECIALLRGEVSETTRAVFDLSLELAAQMLALSGVEKDLAAARSKVRVAIDSGAALEKFRANIAAQGGDPRVCDEPAKLLPLTSTEVKVKSPRTGFVHTIDAAAVGRAVVGLGGGRVRVEDEVDFAVGFLPQVKIGDAVIAGDVLGVIYARDGAQSASAAEHIGRAYEISNEQPATPVLIKEVIAG